MNYKSFVCVAVRRTQRDALLTAISKMPNPVPISPSTRRIIIKPSIYDPNLPGNTSFGMVKAVTEFFEDVAPLSIVESDNPVRKADEAFKASGYESLVSERVNLVNLSKEPQISVQMSGHYLKESLLPRILIENDFLVNLATMKTQKGITMGAAIKNLFGLLPGEDKPKMHQHLSDVLIDLLIKFRPRLNIIDLTYFIEGDRSDSKVRQIGGIVLGPDAVAVDAYCAHLLGFNPLEVNYLRKAYDLGLGEALIERIQVLGTAHQIEQLTTLTSR